MIGMRGLSILIYHRVLAERDALLPGVPDADRFERHMRVLKRFFHVMPLTTAVRHLRQGTLPSRALCITFDDGYADNATLALPILQRHGLHATFFIATSYLDGGQMWNDDIIDYVRQAPAGRLDFSMIGHGSLPGFTVEQKRQAIDHILMQLKYLPFAERQTMAGRLAPASRRSLMMSSDQVRGLLAAGMEVGAHTDRHPILAALTDAEAQADIADGKAALEAITGKRVTLFAYPNGKPMADYTPRHVEMVRALGFEAALSTVAGTAGLGSDLWQLPRYTPWQQDSPRFLMRLLLNRYRENVRRRALLPPAPGG
ncbi:MAG TPA: polysaccharide deacetylase family protein [Duganella sp.]|jgi:peptidoglycan/xylan/chitin deacetylase (PgdA/CDA1 family)